MSKLARRYKAKPAIARDGDGYWVFSKAREVDLSKSSEIRLVRDLSDLMSEIRMSYGWAGISSNNIMWNGTQAPIRIIQIPLAVWHTYLTLINPQIRELSGEVFDSYEGCGSFPGKTYVVPRHSYASLEAMLLDNGRCRKTDLTLGMKHKVPTRARFYNPDILGPVSVLQHEYDHLDGIVIPKLAFSGAKDVGHQNI
jgi:peptide deformylase